MAADLSRIWLQKSSHVGVTCVARNIPAKARSRIASIKIRRNCGVHTVGARTAHFPFARAKVVVIAVEIAVPQVVRARFVRQGFAPLRIAHGDVFSAKEVFLTQSIAKRTQIRDPQERGKSVPRKTTAIESSKECPVEAS